MTGLITRKQIRLKGCNYLDSGYYFITICSKNRENIFGNPVGAGLASARIKNPTHDNNSSQNNMLLSPLGRIIDNQWKDIPNQYDNIELDHYVIMPNHIHGILVIHNQINRADARPAPTIPDIICSFKSKCAVEYLKYIRQNNLNISAKIWQRSFYDHVVRNERSLNAIRKYIANNPENWENDIDNLIDLNQL